MLTTITKYICITFLLCCSAHVIAQLDNKEDHLIAVYELNYIEREPGVGEYPVTIKVSENMLRIDEAGEDSGYIVYDDEQKAVFSVSHHDRSILVINEHKFSEENSPVKYEVEYQHLSDAPTVDGKKIFDYRVYVTENNTEETCMQLQVAESLLPDVQKLLKNYQKVVSGQQVKMTDNMINEMQSACYFIDQIYNTGIYYNKGLPIQEWHSNERSKSLQSFKKTTVDKNIFDLPDDYRRFSIDKSSRTFIK